MTQPELKVELEELLARARQLEGIAFLNNFTPAKPGPPCEVAQVLEATAQIGKSDAEMRWCLEDADDMLADLVDSLREAAKTYGAVDEAAAEAITDNTTPSEGTPKQADKNPARSRSGPDYGGVSSTGGNSNDVFVRARLFYETGDRGVALANYAEHLRRYARWLNDLAPSFYPFRDWEGSAADAANEALATWRTSLKALADDCNKLAGQAQGVKDAYDLIWTGNVVEQYHLDPGLEITRLQKEHTGRDWLHPQPGTVAWVDRICKGDISQMTGLASKAHGWGWAAAATFFSFGLAAPLLGVAGAREVWRTGGPKVYVALQKISDDALANFLTKAGFTTTGGVPQFPRMTPQWLDNMPRPGSDSSIPGWKPTPYTPTPYTPTPYTPTPYTPTPYTPTPGNDPAIGTGGGSPEAGAGLPTMPSLPSDMPSSDVPPDMPATETPPLSGGASLPIGGLGMRAASVGGGGGGVPSMPLQPPVAAESAGSAAGRGVPSVAGGAAAAGGAAMGGRGGMGMAPMAGQGGKGEDSKAKRAQQDEEALYAEDRPWTEAVIGNRRRKDGPDNKESK